MFKVYDFYFEIGEEAKFIEVLHDAEFIPSQYKKVSVCCYGVDESEIDLKELFNLAKQSVISRFNLSPDHAIPMTEEEYVEAIEEVEEDYFEEIAASLENEDSDNDCMDCNCNCDVVCNGSHSDSVGVSIEELDCDHVCEDCKEEDCICRGKVCGASCDNYDDLQKCCIYDDGHMEEYI